MVHISYFTKHSHNFISPPLHVSPTVDKAINFAPGIQPFFHDYLYQQQLVPIAGVDEAGRGACAGPLVVAACILPTSFAHTDLPIDKIQDSKKISSTRREQLYHKICYWSEDFVIVALSPALIDGIGVHRANFLGIRLAVQQLTLTPGYVLIDGFNVPGLGVPSHKVIHGDNYVLAISAASILAKVYRDMIMCRIDQEFPHYGFKMHKGYVTKKHQQALEEFGACNYHRLSYVNVKPYISQGSHVDYNKT